MLDADGLSDETMLAFARETRLAETTFVQGASAQGADYRNRIFTVAEEVPFAGHPSLGTAVAVAAARDERAARYVQQTGAGLQPVEVERRDERLWHASMLQEPAEFGARVESAHVMAAVGLVHGEAHRDHAPQVVSTGLATLVALVRRRDAIPAAAPDFDLVEALLAGCGAVTLYLAWHDGGTARARMFTRLVQGGEDSATGSAVGPLCAYLARDGAATRVEVTQGVEIGRPARLVAEVDGDRVRVTGDVVEVIEGTVSL